MSTAPNIADTDCYPPAGGASYILAKRSINADKKARHEEDMKRRRLKESLHAEFAAKAASPKNSHRKTSDNASSPSSEASNDPAPSEHPVGDGSQQSAGWNQYLATKPYRSKKGDRFS